MLGYAWLQNIIAAQSAPPNSVSTITLQHSTAVGLIAHSGGGQADATKLTNVFNEISVAAADGDSVALPNSQAGIAILVVNNSDHSVSVFPATGEKMATVEDAAATVASGRAVLFTSLIAGDWVALAFASN